MKEILLAALALIQIVASITFCLRARKRYLRTKALHERFLQEEKLCDAARERGDLETARKHLDYMKVLHDAHNQ